MWKVYVLWEGEGGKRDTVGVRTVRFYNFRLGDGSFVFVKLDA